ncbi:MAG: energy transducer TonB [Thermoanaerobaculia bacterium]|nr:energy transducer TonB [Thermoanaerobaculia bacterium]
MRPITTFLAALLFVGCASIQPAPAGVPAEFADIPLGTDASITTKPVLLERVEPEPPPEFRGTHFSATAAVQFVIDEQGNVPAAWHTSGDREWSKFMINAVRRWRFEPALRDGRPVKVRSNVTSSFKRNL